MIYLKEYGSCKKKDALESGLFEVGLNKKSYVFLTECINVSETDIFKVA
jgi:hypothetical protein